jgi:hypothetical protein
MAASKQNLTTEVIRRGVGELSFARGASHEFFAR